MDIGSLIAAALLSLGLIGTDAAINAGNVTFEVGVTRKLADRGYTTPVVDALLDNDLKQIVEFRSMVHRTRIRSADQKSIVGSIAESLSLKDVTAAFQAEFGFDSIRLIGSLMDGETGEFHFLLAGDSMHTGKFSIDMTSTENQTLPVFLHDVAQAIAGRLEPYAVAVEEFNTLQRKDQHTQNDADHEAFIKYVARELKKETGDGRDDSDRAAFYNLLGMASLLYHEHACAAQQFEQAARTDPALGVPQLNLALLALLDQHFDDALRLSVTAMGARELAAQPFLVANVHTIAGLALWGRQDPAGAAAQFHAAVTAYPGSMWAYFYWSELEESLGNRDSAALLRARAEYNMALFESYPEVALMYVRLYPDDGFRFTRVDIQKARHLSDLDDAAPRAEPSARQMAEAGPTHECLLR